MDEDLASLQNLLVSASQMPYNSATQMYRAVNVAVDPFAYGTDCIGKCGYIINNYGAGATSFHFISAPAKSVVHFALVGASHYLDPFLCQDTPLDILSLASSGQPQSVGSLMQDVSINGEVTKGSLVVNCVRKLATGKIAKMSQFSYGDYTLPVAAPVHRADVNLSQPFSMSLLDWEGYSFKLKYSSHHGLEILGNNPGLIDGPEVERACRETLLTKCGLQIADIVGFFEGAKEIQRYLLALKKNG